MIKLFTSALFITLFYVQANAQRLEDYLFPTPHKTEFTGGHLNEYGNSFFSPQSIVFLIEKTARFNTKGTLTVWDTPLKPNTYTLSIDSTLPNFQEYHLTIDSASISIVGKDEAALFYAKQTLTQIISYAKANNYKIPCLSIKDWPDFERRGYMLDISRDKVPTMETLYHIVDLLASWKINEFQLYTEHTFAYKNHQKVWQGCSPMTAEEIQKLDTYCKAKFIDLVPNQNSFGHMENWLKHDEYLHLAECPTDCKTIWGTRSRHSLNPLDPGSFDLMKELYGELLPNFSSTYFNIGCDETVELGNGLSKQACKTQGKGRIYLDFVKKLNEEVNSLGRKTQFWGDIILNHPELIKEIPDNMTAMVWGYESFFPFEKKLPKFKNAGIGFYVCPGTSTWRSEIGRNKDAFANLRQAAKYGKSNGAKGYLNTNWGDWGHWQPLSVCYPTMAVGSAYAWNSCSKPTHNLQHILSNDIFQDDSGNLADALLKLGNSYLQCKIPEGNANGFHLMLRRYRWSMKGHYQTKMLNIENLRKAESEINSALHILKKANARCPNSGLIINELEQAANLAKHGIHLGIARLKAKGLATENINPTKKNELANELKELISKHKTIWTERNRIGGLQSSSKKLEDILIFYRQGNDE